MMQMLRAQKPIPVPAVQFSGGCFTHTFCRREVF
jgi:uncharacterized radical SAM superfamily Fe-S cluster-containing enzyme